MKIALLTDGVFPYSIGGMQKHSYYLAKYFAKNKVFVDLYYPQSAESEIPSFDCYSIDEKQYLNFISISYPKAKRFPGHYLAEMIEYSERIAAKLIKEKQVDFVYAQGFTGTYLIKNKIMLNFNVPIGVNFHGLEMFQKASNLRTKLEQFLFRNTVSLTLRKSDFVFSLGGKLNKIIENIGVKKEKIITIPIGLDSDWFTNEPIVVNKIRKFIFVGRYERRKGIEEINLVLKNLSSEIDYTFEFIGPVPDDKKINLNNVHYHGVISDTSKIRNILKTCDVLVCPSYSEGMPTVIMEGMASGLIVIASNVGAVSEQVNASNGFLIAPGSVRDLKNAVLNCIALNNDKLLEMKVESKKIVLEKFDWDKISVDLIKRIQQIIY